MKGTGYAIALGCSDVWRSKARVLLLWLVIGLATFSSLVAAVVWQESLATRQNLDTLNRNSATQFRLMKPAGDQSTDLGWPGEPLDQLLRAALSVDGTAAALVAGYPSDTEYGQQTRALIGAWPEFWKYVTLPVERGILIGSAVEELSVGDFVNLGPHTQQVIGRLPSGLSMLNSTSAWEVPADLSYALVFLTDYAGFVDTFNDSYAADASSDMILTWLRVYGWSDADIAGLVTATAQAETWRLLPVKVSEDAGYVSAYNGALGLVWLATSLFGVSLAAFVSVLVHAVRRTLKNHGIHRLSGASIPAAAIRFASFALVSLSVPMLLIMWAWYSLPIPELTSQRWVLWWGIAIVVGVSAVTVWWSVRTVMRDALMLATRGTE
ncbi:MAG: hypothetical protein FWG47_03995 [Propionibacteriaceae bacterium]|nr:hypothetical protein [Propionibacteriaceae bacterium]